MFSVRATETLVQYMLLVLMLYLFCSYVNAVAADIQDSQLMKTNTFSDFERIIIMYV